EQHTFAAGPERRGGWGAARWGRGRSGGWSVWAPRRSSGVMPPSPVVVEVPVAVAARPMASLARADRAPKLIPAMVMGISSSTGFLAWRVPSTVLVEHLSR